MSIQRFAAFDQYESFIEPTEMPNSFIVDIENLSPSSINNTPSANSKISVKLQRNHSRKGSPREDRKKTISSASGGITDRSSSTGIFTSIAGCFYPDKTTAITSACLVEENSIAKQPPPMITVSAAKGCNSRKSIKQRAWFVDPRRVLFFFATLSSMGTIVLIYFTLSMSRVSGSANS